MYMLIVLTRWQNMQTLSTLSVLVLSYSCYWTNTYTAKVKLNKVNILCQIDSIVLSCLSLSLVISIFGKSDMHCFKRQETWSFIITWDNVDYMQILLTAVFLTKFCTYQYHGKDFHFHLNTWRLSGAVL